MISKEYLSFTRRERRGIITLVFVLIIVALTPKFICTPKPVAEKLPDKVIQQLSEKTNNYSKDKNWDRDTIYTKKYIYPKYRNEYMATTRPLSGKDERTGNLLSLKNYPARQRWVPSASHPQTNYRQANHSQTRYTKPVYPIDINTADTTAFISLPGIGSKLANRIVSYRTKLGGFNAVEQIKQVYGLRDSVYQLIYPMLTVKL